MSIFILIYYLCKTQSANIFWTVIAISFLIGILGLVIIMRLVEISFPNKNFIIVGFPANNFLWQEPGSNEKIANFCKENYGVSFPMMSKISVKGSTIHPVYKFLTKKSENGVLDSSVSWNFQKYLIDENGYIVRVVSPRTKPDDQSIIDWISS